MRWMQACHKLHDVSNNNIINNNNNEESLSGSLWSVTQDWEEEGSVSGSHVSWEVPEKEEEENEEIVKEFASGRADDDDITTRGSHQRSMITTFRDDTVCASHV